MTRRVYEESPLTEGNYQVNQAKGDSGPEEWKPPLRTSLPSLPCYMLMKYM